MSSLPPNASGMVEPADLARPALDAGTMLREAREAAGWSIDEVSQQLRLHPKQVKALEDGEFALLPGRTFVRGFARNYARLLRLDPQRVVDALPGASGAPTGGLESPPLHATTITMGELPSAGKARPAWLRWAIPAALLVIIVAVIAYQYVRGDLRPGSSAPAAKAAPAVSQAPAPAPAAATAAPAAPAGTPVPNPVVSPPLDTTEAPKAAAEAAPPAAKSAAATEAGVLAPVKLATRGASWVEVKDGARQVLLSQTVAAGQTQAIVGTPPFDVVIGNASDVTLNYRGRVIDLAPYTRGNVARLTLQ